MFISFDDDSVIYHTACLRYSCDIIIIISYKFITYTREFAPFRTISHTIFWNLTKRPIMVLTLTFNYICIIFVLSHENNHQSEQYSNERPRWQRSKFIMRDFLIIYTYTFKIYRIDNAILITTAVRSNILYLGFWFGRIVLRN